MAFKRERGCTWNTHACTPFSMAVILCCATMMQTRLLESAPAKLNLALSVGPINDSGLHPIASWMVTVDFQDDLEVTRLEEDAISRYAILWHDDAPHQTDIDWPVQSDLTVRMHQAIERYTSRRLPIQMKLEKRIPVGAGLGGGSADAAAVLRACNRLFELELDTNAMHHIAGAVGSDIAFLIEGGSAIVEGTGNLVTPQDAMPDFHAVLVLPALSCDTGAVYRKFDELGAASLRPQAVHTAMQGGPRFNDLTEAAFHIQPELREHMHALEAAMGRDVLVSGSGSTLFMTCDTHIEAGALQSAIEDQLGLKAIAVQPTLLNQSTPEHCS